MIHKLPESEGEARGQGLFMAINPWLYRGLSVIFSSRLVQWVRSNN